MNSAFKFMWIIMLVLAHANEIQIFLAIYNYIYILNEINDSSYSLPVDVDVYDFFRALRTFEYPPSHPLHILSIAIVDL